jgi:hypothetical protein
MQIRASDDAGSLTVALPSHREVRQPMRARTGNRRPVALRSPVRQARSAGMSCRPAISTAPSPSILACSAGRNRTQSTWGRWGPTRYSKSRHDDEDAADTATFLALLHQCRGDRCSSVAGDQGGRQNLQRPSRGARRPMDRAMLGSAGSDVRDGRAATLSHGNRRSGRRRRHCDVGCIRL